MQHLREKIQFPVFSVSQGSAGTLIRWSGKIYHFFDCLLSQ